MEADILRLILFLAGLALILGIYLADRYKQGRERGDSSSVRFQDETVTDTTTPAFHDREPLWAPDTSPEDDPPEEEPETTPAEEAPTAVPRGETVDQDLERLGDLVKEEKGKKRGIRRDIEQFSFPFLNLEQAEKPDVVEKKPLPTKLIQLNVVPREGQFLGQEVLYAISEVGLQFGDMDIYHFPNYEDPQKGPLFSMANLVEPGTFSPDQMEDFVTPGLLLFTLLPGPKDGLSIFSEMLHTAERLATLLDGELQDESHSDLSKQTIEHMREEIQEFHRKLQLAKSAR